MNIKNYIIAGLFILPLLSTPALADRSARPGTADARIKSYTYHENEVYYLKGHYGFTMVIEFSPKEKVESISIGDSEAWQVIPGSRKNLIYIKPLEQNAETNMTVLTSKRIYTFELAAAKASSPKAGDLTFRVKFRYPEEETLELANFGSKAAGRYDPLQGADASNWNFDYSYAGSNSLRPKRVYDDGTFTYFEFKKPGMTPAIFSVDEEGNESIVNYNTEGSYMIVNSVGQQFTLRDGNAATCIFNDAFPKDKGKQSRPVPIAELQEKKVKTAKGSKTAKASPAASKAPDTIEQDALASSEKPGFFSYWHGKETTTLNN
jgi:P-type conjugative transfer protein VirB9